MLSLSFVACGGDDDNTGDSGNTAKGNLVSAEQAQTFLSQLEEYINGFDNIEELPYEKFTYAARTTMDDEVMVLGTRYNKQANYFYEYSQGTNTRSYDYVSGQRVLILLTHRHTSHDYIYIDTSGQLVKATDIYDDHTEYFDGQSNRKQSAEKEYRYLAKDLPSSTESFNEHVLSSGGAMFTTYITQTGSMLQTIQPLLALGSGSYGGVDIETRSLGEGHMYVKMSMAGALYEAEINDYFMTYFKTVADYSKLPGGDFGLNYEKVTTEYVFQKDVCDITYPNLSQFELVD